MDICTPYGTIFIYNLIARSTGRVAKNLVHTFKIILSILANFSLVHASVSEDFKHQTTQPLVCSDLQVDGIHGDMREDWLCTQKPHCVNSATCKYYRTMIWVSEWIHALDGNYYAIWINASQWPSWRVVHNYINEKNRCQQRKLIQREDIWSSHKYKCTLHSNSTDHSPQCFGCMQRVGFTLRRMCTLARSTGGRPKRVSTCCGC